MFTFRLNSYRLFQCILIFYVSSEAIASQTTKKCAAFSEYCLNHWDCCSNSCMSYLYRCTRGYNVYPYAFLGVSYKPTVTIDQILEQNFGGANTLLIPAYQPEPNFASRFGDAGDAAATEAQIVLQETEEGTSQATILKNLDGADDVTATDNIVLQKINESSSETTTLKNSIILETSTVLDKLVDAEVNETRTQATINKTPQIKDCAEIGEKCYTREECCNKNCHGYLHKCVT